MKNVASLTLLFLVGTLSSRATFQTYDWPIAEGQAVRSTHYRVWVGEGKGAEQEIDVIQSDAIYEGGEYVDGYANELKGRTFSFASVSYDPATGNPLTFRIEKVNGPPAQSVTLAPRSYQLELKQNRPGKEVSFCVDQPNRYISVDFNSPENRTPNHNWIKHMLCIFVDPLETNPPSPAAEGVVVFTPEVDAEKLRTAHTLYFEKGHYNLNGIEKKGIIEDEGTLKLQENQRLYLEGGAFIEGHISGQGDGQKIAGRGIISGRQYEWNKKVRRSFVKLGDRAEVTGVMVMEAPLHGIVTGDDSLFENTKLLGWHWNNDGFRPYWRSIIRHCFIRCADDFFYNFGLHVHDVVLWPGHNGSIMTYGWGHYLSGGSLVENIDLINPEWVELQNNNGLIMSQNKYNFKPTDQTTVMRNIRIEGSIPGFINLKPKDGGKNPAQQLDDESQLGHIGNLTLENITIDHQFAHGVINGITNAVKNSDAIFYAKNITMKNIRIGDVLLSETNKHQFIKIDPATTRNLAFETGE